MDPYLEGDLWQEFHETLAGAIRAQLLPLLSPKYVALLAKRYVLDRPVLSILDLPPERIIYPDVHVAALRERAAQAFAPPGIGTGESPVELLSPIPEQVPLLSVEIRDVAQRRLVTIIEILSPVNKRGEGLRDYVDRRTELLGTRTHLLEMDLLRQGTRIPLVGELPPASYYVYLSRTQRRPRTQVWPIQLRDKLPTVPAPLLPPDPDVPLDVQAAVKACFDLVGYERLLDYTPAPPPPPLNDAEAAWVAEVLRAAGFDHKPQTLAKAGDRS
jgi:hypothetical protein